jgi:hypothetical protein
VQEVAEETEEVVQYFQQLHLQEEDLVEDLVVIQHNSLEDLVEVQEDALRDQEQATRPQ